MGLNIKKRLAHWREKCFKSNKVARYLRRELKRVKERLDEYKAENKELKKRIEVLEQKKAPTRTKEEVIAIALKLLIVGCLSFRAVSRVMEIYSAELGLKNAPCVQTVINWNTRLAMARVRSAADYISPRFVDGRLINNFIFLIDCSVCIGAHKIFLVLAIDRDHYFRIGAAPTLQDVYCVGIATAETWTGDNVAYFLKKVMDSVGTPTAIVKDAGTELSRGTNLLAEEGYEFVCIDDISHHSANLLKHQYEDHPQLEIFLSACGKISKRFKQTILACLAPPKTTVKSRYMNLHRLVRWGDELLSLSPPGGAKKGSVLAKLRENLGDLPECKNFIKLFHRDASALLACQKILKNKGLSNDTYQECRELLLKTLPTNSIVYSGFMAWLDKHIEIARQLGLDEKGMLITSDNIESCFGRGKARTAGAVKDANRIALHLPAFCGKISEEGIQKIIATTVREQREFEAQLPSVHKQRRKIFGGNAPLESLASETEKTQVVLELVGLPDNRLKCKEQVDESPSMPRQVELADQALVFGDEDEIENHEKNASVNHEVVTSSQEHPEKATKVEGKSDTLMPSPTTRTSTVTLGDWLNHLQRLQIISHNTEEEKKDQERREKAKAQIEIHSEPSGQEHITLGGDEQALTQGYIIISNIIKPEYGRWEKNVDLAGESMPCELPSEPEIIAHARGSPQPQPA